MNKPKWGIYCQRWKYLCRSREFISRSKGQDHRKLEQDCYNTRIRTCLRRTSYLPSSAGLYTVQGHVPACEEQATCPAVQDCYDTVIHSLRLEPSFPKRRTKTARKRPHFIAKNSGETETESASKFAEFSDTIRRPRR